MSQTRFELTEDHVKLLRRARVTWQDRETGAPAIDCKRPYGNGDVPCDVAEILGWELDEYGEMSAGQAEKARWLHMQTEQALRVVLGSGSFQPGVYVLAVDSQQWTWLGPFWAEDPEVRS